MAYINGKNDFLFSTILKGDKGEDGKSAYEYAKEGGFTGTEEEFAALMASGGGGDADYYAHYNYRVHQLTADFIYTQYDYGKRGVGMLALNENQLTSSDFEGGKYTDYGFIIMHPKASGSFSINAGAGTCGCLLVSKGIEHLNVGHGVSAIDLSLFTGNASFPTISLTDSTTYKVVVQQGRKDDLLAVNGWSGFANQIVEEKTW